MLTMNKKNLLFLLILLLLPFANACAERMAELSQKEKKHYYYRDLMLFLSPERSWSGEIKPWERARKASQRDEKQTWSTEKNIPYHDDFLFNDVDKSNVNLRSWLLYQKNYRAGLQIGYQQNPALAVARRSSDSAQEAENAGYFSFDRTVTGYQQQYHNPYIGFVASYINDNLELNGILKFSDWVKARDYNGDYPDQISFYGSNGDARFYSVSGNAGYYLTSATKLVFDLAYAKYDARHAGVSARHYGPERIPSLCENCGGMTSEDYIASIGLNHLF